MFTIEYDSENGIAISDSDAEAYVLNLEIDYKHNNGKNLMDNRVSTENVITAARVLVKEKGLNVQFRFRDKILTPDSCGMLKESPKGFCDYNDNWLDRFYIK